MKIKVTKIAYHRNGISGGPFYVVLFTFTLKESGVKRNMLGVVFETPRQCSVLDVDLLSAGIIEFGQNSFRGDWFEKDLREAITKWDVAHG